MGQVDPKSPQVQTAFAMAALAAAFAETLQELWPHAEALATLQRKVEVQQAKLLHHKPDAAEAAAIFGFVCDSLRDAIARPDDAAGS
jgi:hypothetical protein